MATPIGYLALLRTNRNYRWLWLGTLVSFLGDWFNLIALYTLTLQLSPGGGELALGVVIIIKTLPLALASPLAGVLVDRVNRRRAMIGADLLRAVVVLGLPICAVGLGPTAALHPRRPADDDWGDLPAGQVRLGAQHHHPGRTAHG